MIISCINCLKKFEVNSDLIPVEGRLLQCSACSQEWFFKGTISNKVIKSDKIDNPTYSDNSLIQKKEVVTKKIKNLKSFTNIKKEEEKKFKILNVTVIFIISFVAFIVLIDTFKYPISKIIPNIEFILFNLYESIKDIILFFKDLI